MTDGAGAASEALIALLGDRRRHLDGLLGLTSLHAAAGRFGDALRYADRARRLDPENPVLAGLCARLNLRLGDIAAALRALEGPPPRRRTGSLNLILAEVLLAKGDPAAAARPLDGILTAFAADAIHGLPAVADAVCRHPAGGPSGWVGLNADGTVVGALAPDGARFRQALDPSGRRTLAAGLPADIVGLRALDAAPSWRLAGRVRRRGDILAGSATLGWAPETAVTIVVTDERGQSRRTETTRRAGSGGAGRQVFTLPLDGLASDGPLRVEALTPDGNRQPLYGGFPGGSPAPAGPRRVERAASDRPRRPGVAVIVPVYAGLEETLACLESVLATTDPADTELIVIDDASPDRALKAVLKDLAVARRITLVVNAENRGYPHAVNRGLERNEGRDVVLLNADAEVYGDWLQRLRRAAYSSPQIATVTPFSNHGSMMSYPSATDADVERDLGVEFDTRFRRLNAGRTIDLPSGAGFCLYIKGACVDQIGLLDEDSFGRGYGEENDFCLRAGDAGWRHAGALDVFVRHRGGLSFGALKGLLIDHNLKTLYRRYPAYRRAIRRFLTSDPLGPVRRIVDEQRLVASPVPSALLITLALGGGVEHHTALRTAALQAMGMRVLTLRPHTARNAAGRCRLTVEGEAYHSLVYDLPKAMESLIALLSRSGVEKVEIHHSLGLDPIVLDLAHGLGAPYDVYIHDYSWICPRITLTDANDQYCREPPVEACERCVALNGRDIEEDISVGDLRRRTARVLAGATRVIAPTADAARRLQRYVPTVRPEVTPWEPAPRPVPTTGGSVAAGRPVRVIVIGAIGEHKGYRRLLECARDAAARGLPLEFVVVGWTQDDYALFESGRAFVTGRFEIGEVEALLAREDGDVAFLPSVWPETWCYALTQMLRSGLPVVAFDLGAMSERLSGMDRARLLPPHLETPAINSALLSAAGPRAWVSVNSRRWTPGSPETDGWIEAVRIDLSGAAQESIGYQALLAGEERTPWLTGSTWRSSPGGPRPLIGLAVRLEGTLARTHHGVLEGRFSSGVTVRVATDGADCRSPTPNDPLVALSVTLAPGPQD